MKVAVWDTYVPRKDGAIMHFDIIAPEEVKEPETIYNYGKAYLKSKGQEGQPLTAAQCQFCHIETLKPEQEASIRSQGYFIFEMQHCQ